VQATRRSASVDFINAIAAKQKKNKATKTKAIKATGLLSAVFTLVSSLSLSLSFCSLFAFDV